MFPGLVNNAKFVRHSNAVAAGQTTVTPSAGVDTAGYEACTFVVAFGAITAGGAQSIKLQQSSDDGVADAYSDLEGSAITVADSDDNKLAIIENVKPQKRYLKCLVLRATQDSVVDGIFAVLTGAASVPVTQPSSVLGAETHSSPAEGTA